MTLDEKWEAVPLGSEGYKIREITDEMRPRTVGYIEGGKDWEHIVARAHMVAAAPEMYKALKGLVINRNHAFHAEKPTKYFELMQDYWCLAEHALAKAGGRESSGSLL